MNEVRFSCSLFWKDYRDEVFAVPATTADLAYKGDTRANFVFFRRKIFEKRDTVAFIPRTPITGATYEIKVFDYDGCDVETKVAAESDDHVCEFSSRGGNQFSVTCTISFPQEKTKIQKVLIDFVDICKKDPDLVMTFKVGNVEMKAVTNLMVTRSSVIKTMLNSGCIEAETKTVNIVDFSAEIVQKFIEFCETNDVENPKGFELELYKIAEKYDIGELKKKAGRLVKKLIDDKNVIEMYQFAKTYNDEDMEGYCVQFGRNHWSFIHSTVEFEAVNPAIVVEFWAATRKATAVENEAIDED